MITNKGVPLSILDVTTKKSFIKYDNKDFIKFTKKEDINFLRESDWIIDYSEYIKMSVEDILEEINKVDQEGKELNDYLRTIGFHKTKSIYFKQIVSSLLEKGNVPNDRDYLESLPGVGRKTASVVLSQLFDEPSFAVDTHVFRVSKRLGINHFLWLDHGYLAGDDTDSHIDTLARMCPNDTILYVGCRNVNDEHFEELLKMRMQLSSFCTQTGNKYNLIELPLPDPIFDNEGERLPATYANYLVMNDRVLVPTYNQEQNDSEAINKIRLAFPNHEIIGIDCCVLIKQHGSLHCSTMQIPKGLLNI